MLLADALGTEAHFQLSATGSPVPIRVNIVDNFNLATPEKSGVSELGARLVPC